MTERQFPYGSTQRFHMHHPHLFAADIDKTIRFWVEWFDAQVAFDGNYGGARNVFIKVGIGAIHLYDQPPRGQGRNAIHHLGIQVVDLPELYQRMKAAGVHMPNAMRENHGSRYVMVEAPDGVLLELFEPGPDRDAAVLRYYGL